MKGHRLIRGRRCNADASEHDVRTVTEATMPSEWSGVSGRFGFFRHVVPLAATETDGDHEAKSRASLRRQGCRLVQLAARLGAAKPSLFRVPAQRRDSLRGADGGGKAGLQGKGCLEPGVGRYGEPFEERGCVPADVATLVVTHGVPRPFDELGVVGQGERDGGIGLGVVEKAGKRKVLGRGEPIGAVPGIGSPAVPMPSRSWILVKSANLGVRAMAARMGLRSTYAMQECR